MTAFMVSTKRSYMLKQTCRFGHIYWRKYPKIPNKGSREYRPTRIYAHQKRPFSRHKTWVYIRDFTVLLENFIFCITYDYRATHDPEASLVIW